MPELPEVETTVKGLSILIGFKVINIKLHTKKLRYIIPNSIHKIKENSKIISIKRLAKYILIEFSSNYTLVIHLGMSGRLKILEKFKQIEKHDHFVLYLGKSKKLVFNDPRRFGFIDFDQTNKIYLRKYFMILGVDALSNDLNSNYIFNKIHKSDVQIKQILLNQHIIAGIGNIYASEILFDSKISPFLKGKNVSKVKIKKLIRSIRKILLKAIEHGGSSIKNYVSSDGKLGNFQDNFVVYNQEGKKIYNSKVKKVVQYGRATFYCPKIQK